MNSRMSSFLEVRMTTTKGFRMSFWKEKLVSSARSRYLSASWRMESMAYMATCWSGCCPAAMKCTDRRAQMRAQIWPKHSHGTRPHAQVG